MESVKKIVLKIYNIVLYTVSVVGHTETGVRAIFSILKSC
mgnify:CR=1 FL=1